MKHTAVTLSLLSQLCYLHADLFRSLNTKETKKQFVEFNNTFLDKGAVSSALQYISCKRLTDPDWPWLSWTHGHICDLL